MSALTKSKCSRNTNCKGTTTDGSSSTPANELNAGDKTAVSCSTACFSRSACTEDCKSTSASAVSLVARNDDSDNGTSTDSTTMVQRSCIPLPLAEEQLKELVADARDFALLHGAGMRYRDSYSVDTLSMAPFFLLPTPFPRRDFEKVYNLQPLINKLMHRVAHDYGFLEKCLRNTIKVDDFTRRLWEIYTTVREEGVRQPVSLALMRCDVLLDTPRCDLLTGRSLEGLNASTKLLKGSEGQEAADALSLALNLKDCHSRAPAQTIRDESTNPCDTAGSTVKGSEGLSPITTSKMLASPSVLCCSSPKQVEVNTIASSFAALSGTLNSVHKYVLNLMGRQDLVANLPPNNALQELCGGMIAAWDMYSRPQSIILFVVEDVSYNICDQRFHEYEIMRQRPNVRVVRRTLTQIHETASLDGEGRLWVKCFEVAVVYFRSGYDPSGYHGPGEWAARLMIERSLAIKCPSVHYHLAGTKKVQQELAAEGSLLPFLTPDEADSVAQLFTGLYTLDMGPEGDRTVAMALQDPDRFVLKPQREGGGNNIYGEDIKLTLERIGQSPEREAFILMDRIRAPVQTNYLVRPQKDVVLSSVISELGIFGALLGTPTEILLNRTCGHMLRSKLSTNNEGGVASGNGALDSVLLVD